MDIKIAEISTKTLSTEPYKYLGRSMVTNLIIGPSRILMRKLKSGLKNIDRAKHLKGQDKLKILQNYFLPSLQFDLMVHEISPDNLARMDKLTHGYKEKWAPGHTATATVRPSKLYEIVQIQAYVHRLQSDDIIMSAVQQKLHRETNPNIAKAAMAFNNN